MPQSRDIVQLCAADLLAKVKEAVAGDQHLYVYDTDVLLAQKGQVKFPMIAVLYSGMMPADVSKNPNSVKIRFTVQVMYGEVSLEKQAREDKSIITGYLRSIRDCIRDQRAPTGHKYNFAGEGPAPVDEEYLVYAQQWMVEGTIT